MESGSRLRSLQILQGRKVATPLNKMKTIKTESDFEITEQ